MVSPHHEDVVSESLGGRLPPALVECLRCVRLTLEMKCSGLDAEALARRSVEPSTMSLLGLVRHLAEMERHTFRNVTGAIGTDSSEAIPRYP